MSSFSKCISRNKFLFFAPVLLTFAASAATPDFTGNWLSDSSQNSGQTITLTIQQTSSGQIAFHRTLQERDGRKIEASFTCAPDGSTCDFNEDGHKAKVQVWYSGSTLNIAKTDGRSEDATVERALELSQDGKTLTVEFTNYSGTGKAEKLVFKKQ